MTTINKTSKDIAEAMSTKYKATRGPNNSPNYKIKLRRGQDEVFLSGVVGQGNGNVLVIDANGNKYLLEETDIVFATE